ncbi:MAG: LacI family DNA-binding transcriptional regulator [Natronospirillum sp.]
MNKNTEPRHQRSKGRVTLADVANQAGTSAITVSRVLNNPDQVSSELRTRVLAAVDATGYVPNRAARSLAGSRSYTIGVIIPSLSNAVFSNVIRGIYDVCNPANYELIMGNSYYSVEQERSLLQKFIHQNPDGLIMAGLTEDSAILNLLHASGLPVVQIMEVDDTPPFDMCVGISHYAAGAAMADYFLSRNYRAPSILAAQLDRRTQKRMAGFLDHLQRAGHSSTRVVTSAHPSSVKLGGELLNDLLAAHPDTDAVFCCNDDLAWGAIFECQRRHLVVPDQLAVSGFNDLDASAYINPALTSVAIPLYDVGAKAASMLLQRINGQTITAPVLDLGFSIKSRSSA